jgi:hypothetical protein
MQTGVAYEGDTTNGLGIYRVLNLPVGQYALTFSKDGFKTYERTGVTVSMSQNVTLNAKLEVGSRVDSVTVSSDASLLDTQDAMLGSTVSGDVLTDLPLTADGGRDARNFARSVVATYSTVTGPQLGYNNSVAGSQIVSQATSVDGTSADAGLFGIVNAPGMDLRCLRANGRWRTDVRAQVRNQLHPRQCLRVPGQRRPERKRLGQQLLSFTVRRRRHLQFELPAPP